MDPATIAIVTAVSTGVQAMSAIQQGNAANASAQYNAKVQQNNAQIALNNAAMEAEKGSANTAVEQQKTRAKSGSIKAAQAANGVDINKGSALDVQSSAAELGELNAITIRSNAARSAYGYQTEASNATVQEQLDKQQGKNAQKAGYISAGTTILGQTASAAKAGNYDAWLDKTSVNGDDDGYYAYLNEGM